MSARTQSAAILRPPCRRVQSWLPSRFASAAPLHAAPVSPPLAHDHKSGIFPPVCNVRTQIAQEADQLKRYPTEEAEEIALIYAARGIPLEEARTISEHLIANPEKALDTLAREELGLNPDDLGSSIGAALSSFVAFAIGATLPLIPFLFGFSAHGITIAATISGIALFVGGAVLSLFSGKNALWGLAHAGHWRGGRCDLWDRFAVQRRHGLTRQTFRQCDEIVALSLTHA